MHFIPPFDTDQEKKGNENPLTFPTESTLIFSFFPTFHEPREQVNGWPIPYRQGFVFKIIPLIYI